MRHERARLAPDRPWSARGSLECPLVRFNDHQNRWLHSSPAQYTRRPVTCPGADFRSA